MNPNQGDCPVPNVPEPRIHLSWQTKLVPTTRLAESIWWQRGELGSILRRTPPVHTPLGSTH
jgi:hypothetical protein